MIARKVLPHLLLILGLATLAALALNLPERAASRPAPDCDTPGSCIQAAFTVPVSPEEELAFRHVPVVYLPELDRPCRPGGSSFAPIPVEAVLENPEVSLRGMAGRGGTIYGPTAADLWDAGSSVYFGSYLDLPGDPLRPGCSYERDSLRFTSDTRPVAYARLTREWDKPGLVLQYWLFYYFNDWNNKHEADWELVQLYFEADDPVLALAEGPSKIALSAHRGGSIADWSDEHVAREGERPVIYVARGSHANYFKPGIYLGRGEAGRGLGCDDASHSSRRVSLEARLLPRRISGPDDPYAWLAFKGYWGEVGRGTEGSTAPVTKRTWIKPYTWQEGLDPRSISLPARGLLGPDPARAFCNVVAFGSEFLLPLYHDLPTVSVLLAAAASAGVFASLASTRYLPVRSLPLRARRRVGQVITAAVDVYLRHLYVFLTLGLFAFPVGLLSSQAYQWLGFAGIPDGGIGLPYWQAGTRVALAVVFNGLGFGLTALLVMAATVVAVGRIEQDRPVDAFAALWTAAVRLPQLLLAKLLALASIAVLCLTIAGIPLALRQAVRWSLSSHAVLLEGRSARAALAASSRLVAGSWWHALITLTLLGALAVVVAPAAGILLLFSMKSLAPGYVGLIAAALHALLVPFIGIALTLLYFDLERRRSGG